MSFYGIWLFIHVVEQRVQDRHDRRVAAPPPDFEPPPATAPTTTNGPFRTSAAPSHARGPSENDAFAYHIHKLLTDAGYTLERYTDGTPHMWRASVGDCIRHVEIVRYIRALLFFNECTFPRLTRWFARFQFAGEAYTHAMQIVHIERTIHAALVARATAEAVARIERALVGK
jgi:hypothetical protein